MNGPRGTPAAARPRAVPPPTPLEPDLRTSPRIALLVAAALAAGPSFAAWPEDPAVNVPLCTAPRGQQFPVAAPDGAGGAIVAWLDLRGNANFDIYAQRVLGSGAVDPAWPADGRALCTAGGDQQYPAIAPDGASGAFVVWCDARGGSFDLYAQHVLASGAVDPAWPANGLRVCGAPGGQWFPAIIGDGAGGAIVAWQDHRDGAADVYAQRLLASGAVDPAWPADGLALCTAGGDQVDVQAVSDGAGGALLAWSDARDGAGADVYAHHVLGSGAADPAWPADGVALCVAPGAQLRPRLVADGAGGAIAAWSDVRSGAEYDVYAMRVLASGATDPAWPANGRAVCSAPSDQLEPAIAPDGAAGALVVWRDHRGGPDGDVYAQRVLASGALDPAWPATGLVVCAEPEPQHSTVLAADGAGGAVVAWADRRGGNSHDLYAQHVLATGVVDPAWPAGGRAVCVAPGDQQNPALAAAHAGPGAGSAPIVAWDDDRAGNYDIYAQPATPVVAPGPPEPALVSVRDVRPDEGGFVTVSWAASGLDVAPSFGITDYRVWRAPPAGGWQVAAVVPATARLAYALDVATTGDSTAAGTPVHAFRVEARGDTLDPTQRWFSAPDSAWSVDDLAPGAPSGFGGVYAAGLATLWWGANAEADLASYRLYRDEWPDFEPGPANLLAELAVTAWFDPAGAPYAYKLSAVDVHGNESAHTLFLPDHTAGAGHAAAPGGSLALAGAHPAPGAVALRFRLPAAGRTTLAIHDPSGRRVRTLVAGELAAGEHARSWDGRDDAGRRVPAGLYFARLASPGFAATLRIVRAG